MKPKHILVTGGSGMVGHALQRVLPEATFLSSADCDLRDTSQTKRLMADCQPDACLSIRMSSSNPGSTTWER